MAQYVYISYRIKIMSGNILYTFAKDLSQLYSKIQVKDVEAHFVRIAQTFDVEVEKWLAGAVQLNTKASLQKPEVLDTLIILARLKKSYPAGMSYSEFAKAFFNDPKLKFFLPIILAIRDAASGQDFAILSPYLGILEATRNMNFIDEDSNIISTDVGTVQHDLHSLDTSFRDDLNRKLNKSYESDYITTNKRMTKKERLSGLLNYLTRRFASEVNMAFEEAGIIDVIGISEDDSVLRDPAKIMETMYPNYPKNNTSLMVKEAQEMAKFSVRNSDIYHYDLVYNTIKAKIMYMSASMSRQDYHKFMYESNLQTHNIGDEPSEESDSINVPSSSWLIPQNLMFLSITLYVIASKIR